MIGTNIQAAKTALSLEWRENIAYLSHLLRKAHMTGDHETDQKMAKLGAYCTNLYKQTNPINVGNCQRSQKKP